MKKIIVLSIIGLFFILFLYTVSNIQINFQTSSPSITPTPTVQNVLGEVTKNSNCRINGPYEDKSCTPGAIDPRVTQENIQSTICVSGYTKTVRPPQSVTNKIKKERMQAYGDTDSPVNYELDHLIPLEIGGCPDCIANLWPEPADPTPGFHQKDVVENYLHKAVCEGKISLSDAQQEIVNDWLTVYNQIENTK